MNIINILIPIFRKYMVQQFPIVNKIVFAMNFRQIPKNIRCNKFTDNVVFFRQLSCYFNSSFRNIYSGRIKTHFRKISYRVARPTP